MSSRKTSALARLRAGDTTAGALSGIASLGSGGTPTASSDVTSDVLAAAFGLSTTEFMTKSRIGDGKEAAPRSVPPPTDFEAAPAFAGARAGFVFKSGAHGLGYYKDKQQWRQQQQQQQQQDDDTFVAAAEFSGARPGFVFKAGSAGLGYYLDDGGSAAVASAASTASCAFTS